MTGADRRALVETALVEANPDALYMDGMEEAIVGIATQFTHPPIVVYDREAILSILEREMSPEDAEEYLNFNIEGAWVGEHTPLILTNLEALANW